MKSLFNIINEKLIINKNSKIKKENIPSIENILKYINETYDIQPNPINKIWVQDEFYDQHYSPSLINTIEKDNNITLKPQNFFCTKPIFSKKEAESLCGILNQAKNNDYNKGILYFKNLGKFGWDNTYRAGFIYDYTLDLEFLNSIYNK